MASRPHTVCVLAREALVHVICTSECMASYLANQLTEIVGISPSDLAIYPSMLSEEQKLVEAGVAGDAFIVDRMHISNFLDQVESQFT
jgi:hypothetical protein